MDRSLRFNTCILSMLGNFFVLFGQTFAMMYFLPAYSQKAIPYL